MHILKALIAVTFLVVGEAFTEVGDITCGLTADSNKHIDAAEVGQKFSGQCAADCKGTVWGSAEAFTSDSSICSAAWIAGINGGKVVIEIIGGQSSFTAVPKPWGGNTKSYGKWPRAYKILGKPCSEDKLKTELTQLKSELAQLKSELAQSKTEATDAKKFVVQGVDAEGKRIKLIRVPVPSVYTENDVDKYAATCRAFGAYPIGCGMRYPGTSSGYCPKSWNGCIAMPSSWSCNMITALHDQTGWDNIVALFSNPIEQKHLFAYHKDTLIFPTATEQLHAVCAY